MNLNKVFDYDDFSSPEFNEVREFATFGVRRKSWENFILSYGFKRLRCFGNEKIALGLGCLREPLIFLLANYFGHVYATDIAYYPSKFWGKHNYTPEQIYRFNKIPYDRARLTVMPMDMKHIEFEDNTFDVIWSSSSVEHIGELPDILQCFKEIKRTLKVGGVCGMTTEWNLEPTNEIIKFGNILYFDNNVLEIIEKEVGLLVVEPVNTYQSSNPKNLEPEYLRGRTHFPSRPVNFTSASLFWRKNG